MSRTAKKSPQKPAKPTYVKKLNFGQRLEPNLKTQQPVEVIESFLPELPDKQDNQSFVNDWLTKNDDYFDSDSLVYPSSPVLGSSFIKRTPGSPIIGNLRKRRRTTSKESEKEISNNDHSKRKDAFVKSPVLINKIRLRKLRQKRLSQGKSVIGPVKLNNSLKSECVKLKVSDKISRSSVDKKSKTEERERIEETFYEEDKIEKEIIEESLNKSSKIVFGQPEFSNFRSCVKEGFFKVTKSPEGFKDNESTFIEEATESEDTPSDFIEDVDTPDVFNNVKEMPVKLKEKIPVRCQSPSKDSDETFFSGAGSCQSQYRQQPSQKISDISSSKIKADSLSQVNNVISMETASPKNVQSFFNTFRTDEKKRRLKKGSLAAKLENLVNTERSFVRMWQHKISQKTFQNDSIQFVDLCIQRYYTSYNRQFAECRLIADAHNLLKDVVNLQTEPGVDSQTVNSNNLITVMIIPEVAGGLSAKRGKRLKVYPPLHILDQENIIISVTYFTVDENLNFTVNQGKSPESVKKERVKKFDCPCIQEGRIVEDCSLRFKSKRPNVIKEIFSIPQ